MTINTSSGSDGFSVGQCCSYSISGDLVYKGYERKNVRQNSKVVLQCNRHLIGGQIEPKQYIFFIKSYTVENNEIIHFSAQDAMAYVDNNYPMEQNVSVASHYKAAAKVISEVSDSYITINEPANPTVKIKDQSGWNIRTLLQYGAVYGAENYYCHAENNATIIGAISDATIAIKSEEHSVLSVGAVGKNINLVRISTSDNEDPILEEGQTYEDFGIYYIGSDLSNKANCLRLVCPWADIHFQISAFLVGLPNQSYGTEFNCDQVKVNELYPPFTKLKFEDFDEGDTFYISSATYKLTKAGIIANVSGTTKALSDYEYIGKTETELKTKVAINMGYKYGFVTQENGIYWDDAAVPPAEVIDSG